MSFKDVTIGTEGYKLPLAGANPPWGEELSDIIQALIDAANVSQGPNDIQETSATLLNTAGAKNIVGLAFNPAQVRSVEVSYNISRQITKAISNIPTGTGVIQIDCSDDHNLIVGETITIASSNSTPSIDGVYTVQSVVDSNSITIDIGATTVTVAGTSGSFDIELVESGLLFANYGQQGWALSQERIGNSKTDIEVNSSGQFTYEPVVLDGTTHIGLIKFIAKALITT
jgi:hypothetical protein